MFESGLIVLGLVGALGVNEWRDTHERDQRVRQALASIEAEIGVNARSIDAAIQWNRTVIAALEDSLKSRKPYGGAIIRLEPIGDVAWQAARDAAVTRDIPLDRLIVLGRAYTAQEDYLEEVRSFRNAMYSGGPAVELRERSPLLLAGIMNDFTNHATTLKMRYSEALAALQAR